MSDTNPSHEIAVQVNDVHKEFILPQSKNTSFKQLAVNMVRSNNKVTQKVLDGVSFDVRKGDFFGVVGRNGSGKSTLLKLLAGVYTPTSGDVQVYGGLTPFIELGVGFNPELSGRDNVYLNGALLGFNRTQMDDMYDEIVSFAELGPFMDQKLKNYSSGMQVRLAFSIAIKAKNEILIFDEVLAVGDEAFQRKCLDVFERYKAEGQTVILVTHDMETVRKYCNRAILISEGKLIMDGNPQEVADEYSRLNQTVIDDEMSRKSTDSSSLFTAKLAVDQTGKAKNSFVVGESVKLEIAWPDISKVESVMVDLYRISGEHISNFISDRDSDEDVASLREMNLEIDMNIAPGKYYFNVYLWKIGETTPIAVNYETAPFSILNVWSSSRREFGGLTGLEAKWS